MRNQVRHIHSGLTIFAPLAMAAQAEGVCLKELAVDLAEARRQRLRIEPVQERLGVEEIHLAGAAGHEQKDAALGFGRKMPSSGGKRSAWFLGASVAAEQVGEPEQTEAASGHFEEFATAARQERLGAGAAIEAGLGSCQMPRVEPVSNCDVFLFT